jgi:hypothetical protein
MYAADFTEHERKLVQVTLLERYGRPVPLQAVEVELQLDPTAPIPGEFPAFYWQQEGAEFVISKTGPQEFRAQFFYSPEQMFGTGVEKYDNLGDCVVSLLQVQAEHAAREAQRVATQTPNEPRRLVQPAITGDDYDGPLVI